MLGSVSPLVLICFSSNLKWLFNKNSLLNCFEFHTAKFHKIFQPFQFGGFPPAYAADVNVDLTDVRGFPFNADSWALLA